MPFCFEIETFLACRTPPSVINFPKMANPLLVLSPQKTFGELIAKSFPEFDTHVTADFSDAIRFVRQNPTCPVLLDSELNDFELSAQEIGQGLRQVSAEVSLVLITRPGESVPIKDLPLRGTLIKPIALPKLRALLLPPKNASAPELDTLKWLHDENRAARHLTRLMMESSAQAALITRKNELWAYAGQLSSEAAQELARSAQQYWDSEAHNDLLKFIRLTATDSQHMLYARRLTASMALALVFDAETPLSAIRTQAGKLVRELAEVSQTVTSQVSLNQAVAAEEEEDFPPIANLLGEVPPPLPPKQTAGARSVAFPWERETPSPFFRPTAAEPTTQPPPLPKQVVVVQEFSRESSPPIRRDEKAVLPSLEETRAQKSRREEDLAETRAQKSQPDPQSIIETHPQSVTEVARRIMLEPGSASMYNLNYACLLVPRFDNHHLTGDLSDRLNAWVPQICVAFGWRLEHLAVRPDYLQWVVSVPPATAPNQIARMMSRHTSDRILNEFPRFKTENASSEFWAQGYLIMGGLQPHSAQMVRDFIRQTRHRQGLLRDSDG